MNDLGDLIRLIDLDPDFIINLKYAGPDNFTGQTVYSSGECYINKHTALLLIQAKNAVKAQGFRMKIWDAYRPISAQRRFWDILPNNDFVARPPDMEKLTEFRPSHMNGQCVDVTLTDTQGCDIPMPSEFDDFSERATLSCPFTEPERIKNALILRSAMEQAGFASYDNEWWHFYDVTTPPAPYLDVFSNQMSECGTKLCTKT